MFCGRTFYQDVERSLMGVNSIIYCSLIETVNACNVLMALSSSNILASNMFSSITREAFASVTQLPACKPMKSAYTSFYRILFFFSEGWTLFGESCLPAISSCEYFDVRVHGDFSLRKPYDLHLTYL